MLTRALIWTARNAVRFSHAQLRLFANSNAPRPLYEQSYDTSPLFADRVPIYRLRQIFACAIVNKLKKYQVLVSGVVVPVSWVSRFADLIDTETAAVISLSSIACTGVWFAFGQIFVHLVGFIYVGQTNHNRITVSYLDFWGNRIDRDLKPEEIETSDLNERKMVSVMKTTQFPYKLRISMRYGEVVEPFWFDRYFFDEVQRQKASKRHE